MAKGKPLLASVAAAEQRAELGCPGEHLSPPPSLAVGQDIKELFLDLSLFTKGTSVFNFSYPVCEDDQPKFSFCGRRKGGKWAIHQAA